MASLLGVIMTTKPDSDPLGSNGQRQNKSRFASGRPVQETWQWGTLEAQSFQRLERASLTKGVSVQGPQEWWEGTVEEAGVTSWAPPLTAKWSRCLPQLSEPVHWDSFISSLVLLGTL